MALLKPVDHGSLDDSGRGPHLASVGGYTKGGDTACSPCWSSIHRECTGQGVPGTGVKSDRSR